MSLSQLQRILFFKFFYSSFFQIYFYLFNSSDDPIILDIIDE
jgi:hypothetical protein